MAKEKEERPMDVASMSALIEAQRKQIAKLEKELRYPAAWHPMSVFHGMVTSGSQPFQYEVNKNR